MLNNLYRPLEEGTHTYSQIDDRLSKRYLDSIDKMSELQKRFHNGELSADEFIKQDRRNDAFRSKIGKIRDKTRIPLHDKTVDFADALKNYRAVRGLNHRKDINKAIHDKYVGGKVLKTGAGIAAGGLALAGLRKYLKEHPDSVISKKIKAFKERFKRK